MERRGAWVRRAESAGAVWAMTNMIYRVLQWADASGGVTRRCITRSIPNVALALPGKNSASRSSRLHRSKLEIAPGVRPPSTQC